MPRITAQRSPYPQNKAALRLRRMEGSNNLLSLGCGFTVSDALPAELRRKPPRVFCPACANYMHLTTAEIDERHRETLSFTCSCGFTYRQSHCAKAEAAL
jgi:hypothetical protein